MDTRIAAALAHMEQRLAAPITIGTLAAAVNLSPSRFAHLFRRDVGTSPARYLHVMRMLRARILLERTFLTVKEVMVAVGCNDASHFSRDFREIHGLPPRTYRLDATRSRRTKGDAVAITRTASAVASIAAIANERRVRPKQPHARARAPGLAWKTRHEYQHVTGHPGGLS